MKLSKRIVLNICALVFLVTAMIVDWFLVKEVEDAVIASCETSVGFDKSGSMVCLELPPQSVKVAQQ